MNSRLLSIINRFAGDLDAAIKFCIRVSIERPQFCEEYERYAKILAGKL